MTRRPPTPDGLPVLGHTIGFAVDPFGYVADLLADHGVDDVVGLDVLGMDDLYVLAHPDHFERALVTERDAFSKGDEFLAAFGDAVTAVEGDEWKRQRSTLDPFFRWGKVETYTPEMSRQIERRLETWPDSGTVPLESEMKNLTLDIIFATILGRELDVDGDERIRAAADGLNGRFSPASWVLPSWVPTPSRRRFDRSNRILREEVRDLVETANEDSLAARLADALGSEYPQTVESMEDQLVGMIFAGHETTALALTFTCYFLATHADVRERAVEEVDRVVGDGPVTAETTERLPLLERVLKESLRLYPPVHTIPRETSEPFSVGDRTIPAGTDVHLSILRLHRDERWYDDPGSFRPERWADEDEERSKYAYLPFGAGPRSCLGRAFALTEAKLALATILRDFDVDWGADGPLEVTPEMTTQPKGSTPLVVRRR
ncbi:cytochrome P450 [Haloferax sp. MBLA0076]|uniref:Cytochrome P450 n=1 Tax=Haloferax litoreum TaxID=2666140 RepID=A0A6A8GHW8_9EURY|nr:MULTISPECIES: cytochrome P450 [Haloferax]KAB1194223.1 cytochrome P450 [Haloferax sp. CBA1148]MRX22783.1 cytochrome P450 [Haloferax litoreum]